MIRHSVTPSVGQIPDSNQYMKENESQRERFEKWFYDPLRRMNKHDGFAIITLLFPLYERHLRLKYFMNEKVKFTESCKAFKQIAKDLSIPLKIVPIFWRVFRNGAMHYGQPKDGFRIIYHDKNPLQFKDEIFFINPIEFRDLILSKFESFMWTSMKIPDSYISIEEC